MKFSVAIRYFFWGLLLGLGPLWAFAQPPNDDCANAELIVIPNGGHDYGIFVGSTHNMSNATLQTGETFPAGVPNGKSIWYRFTLPTTREVRITLSQTGAPILNPNDGGWTLYKTNACIPGPGEVVNPPIQNIEGFTHECLRAGDYLIQVGTDLAVTGNLFIDLDVRPVDPSAADVPYDYAASPYDFQIVSGTSLSPSRLNHFYDVACQSTFNGETQCGDTNYTKSTWHVFSTDAWVDYFRFEVGENPFSSSVPGARIWYYNLYQGDVRTDSTNLTAIDSCKTLTQVSATSYGTCFNTCQLDPNSTYSIQLLHPTEYFAQINTRVYEIGSNQTISPNPLAIPASHQLGILPSGSTQSLTDYFACNGLTSRNNCGTVVTDSVYNGSTPYDLNFWMTFEVPFDGNVRFDLNSLSCGPTPLVRIFQGDVSTAGCNLPLDTSWVAWDRTYNCMPPGQYSLQVLGQMNSAQVFTNNCGSNLSDGVSVNVTFSQPAVMQFGLFTPAEIEDINGLAPLVPATTYTSTQDFFDCRTTAMPAGQPCNANNNRAMYRRFVLNQPGTVTIDGSSSSLQYSVFQGDAGTAPIVANQLQGLTDVSGCRGSAPFRLCLQPGTYTLVTYGDNSDVARADQSTIRFDRLWHSFGLWTPSDFDDINGGLPLTSGNTYNSLRDTFDCRTSLLPANGCGGGYDRAMYREFTLNQPGRVTLGGGNLYLRYRLYQGGADTATVSGGLIQNLVPESNCMGLWNTTWSACLGPGRYTLVTFGDAGDWGRNDRPWIRFNVYTEAYGLRNPTEFNELNGFAPLVSGTPYSATSDTFDCDVTPLPASGCPGNDRAMYRTFTINSSGTLTVSGGTSGHSYRLYLGGADTASIVGNVVQNLQPVTNCFGFGTTLCIQPGRYTLVTFGNNADVGRADAPTVQLNAIPAQQFDLDGPNRQDTINGGTPLVSGTTYNAAFDQFDCDSTVVPAGGTCGAANDRVIYRRITIGQDGILVVGGGVWQRFRYRLYRGDASTLPIVNGEIQGLVDQVECQSTFYPFKVCVSPGIYTLATFGDPGDLGFGDSPWLHFESFPPTSFTDPASPEILPNLNVGTPIVQATGTRFNCDDNPLDILGNTPCGGATKQVYREFFLDRDYCVTFTDQSSAWYTPFSGIQHRIFRGRISTGPDTLSALVRNCGTNWTQCLDSGWYTVVSYGFGENYASPTYTSGLGESLGELTRFQLQIDTDLQQFGSFATADQVNSGNPIFWEPDYPGGHTAAVPRNFKTYILDTEHWDCADNLPFEPGITPCDPSYNRVSYRVFTLSKPSYIYIHNLNPSPGNYQSRLYQGDITASAPPYAVAHDCIRDQLRACLAPGTYTLATFANNNHIKRSITPRIYLDSLGTSKYDHATNAYDFGNIPGTNTEYFQNLGDSPDVLGRPQSNDFFFCSTGAQTSDTINVCPIGTSPPPNALPNPTNPRRNLWYTFTLSGGGTAHISVYNLTPGKGNRSPFAIYRSDDLIIPPVDSTTAQGLTFVGRSTVFSCFNQQTVSFTRNNCVASTDRYYILVDNHSSNEPNTQIQVGVRYDPGGGSAAVYDHYSWANVIDTAVAAPLCAPPYNPIPLGQGTYTGCATDLTCYTQDPTDQNSCGSRTAWYKFEVDGSGRVRINWTRPNGSTLWNNNNMQLYREIVPGDSSSSGLQQVPLNSVFLNNNPDFNPGTFYQWGQGCVTPGTYYIMFTGCNYPTETVLPRIWLEPIIGDYCSDSIRIEVPDTGIYQASGRVDCWTIGEAPGEDGTNMDCLGGPTGLKSGWFHISITDTNKMDLDIELDENTSASALQVRYRVGVGPCNALTYDECVDEGTFIILNLKCRQDSGLWIQVVVPENDTGTVTVKVTATVSADTACVPRNPDLPTANFDFVGGCEGETVYFTNNSSSGSGITYLWDFGDGFTSTLQNPNHTYSAPSTGNFIVTLIVDNGLFQDTTQRIVSIYPKPNPSFSFSPPNPVAGGNISLTNTSTGTLPTATYYWNFCAGPGPCSAVPPTYVGAAPPPVTYTTTGTKVICLTVTNGGCDSTYCDTIDVSLINLFTGGPFDGHAELLRLDSCFANLYTGGPYDGFDVFKSDSCELGNIFAGGPYDGFDVGKADSCTTVNIFAGGPYDGFDLDVQQDSCLVMTNIFQGGPFDGFAYVDSLACPLSPSIWLGGPFDGHAELQHSDCQTTNIFAGGPYDGHDWQDSSNCAVSNIFTGGPYDGFDMDGADSCEAANIFAGGPYDGFDVGKSDSCEVVNIFTGGPYDGFDVDVQNSITVTHDTVCRFSPATLAASAPTNWYDQSTGGAPIATNSATFTTPPLSQTTLYWVDDICNGTERFPVQACVLDSLRPDAAISVNCAGQLSFFTNQTQIAGPSTPSFGFDITGFSNPNGVPPGPQELAFSSSQQANFGMLYDGVNNGNQAWTGNNGGPTTMWAQWVYLTPKAVNRFYYWNNPNAASANRAPTQVRLYYSNGGPWTLVKAFFPPWPSNGIYDSGLIPSTNATFATRWKLEFDVDAANAPQFGEFQVFASDPVVGGNVLWNFGDGNTSSLPNPSHTYVFPDTYFVSLTVDVPGTCPATYWEQVIAEDCGVLAVEDQLLDGRFVEALEAIELKWYVQGSFDFAHFQKFVDGRWENISHPVPDEGDSIFLHLDTDVFWGLDNLYRVRSVDQEGREYFSNSVLLNPDRSLENSLVLYPNPVSGNEAFLQLTLAAETKMRGMVVDALGRVVREIQTHELNAGIHTVPFSTEGLAVGTYFVRVELLSPGKGGEWLTKKLVVKSW